MEDQVLVQRTMQAVSVLLKEQEQVQARAAALVQRWNKLGGSAFLAGMTAEDWTAVGVAEADFLAAMSSLGTAFPDVLGDHGTNLYKIAP